ncbi:MAG: hypothetical protein Q4P66_08540 [Actinomycetaceae bacterium]|nr:hypothetical protein [Actinomycetaceae bacterium]
MWTYFIIMVIIQVICAFVFGYAWGSNLTNLTESKRMAFFWIPAIVVFGLFIVITQLSDQFTLGIRGAVFAMLVLVTLIGYTEARRRHR